MVDLDKPAEQMTAAELIAAVTQLRYERRLLGATRMVLDLIAAGSPDRWPQARAEAADLSQRIVDEIGHPTTDEPALGGYYRDVLAGVLEHAADLDRSAEARLHAIRSICRQALDQHA